MKDNNKRFKISDIDIDKIRVSEKMLYSKEHNSYKHYVFYEHDNEYIPLRIILKDVVGYYNDNKDSSKYDIKYSAKRVKFKLNNDYSLNKVHDIFDNIKEKLDIGLNNYIYESIKGEQYLKTIVSDETCFKDNIIPSESTNYTCRVLLQIQSLYFNMKDNKDDIEYYPQVLLGQCVYKFFFNNIIIYPDLEFTDTESDSEEEINKNTAFDE